MKTVALRTQAAVGLLALLLCSAATAGNGAGKITQLMAHHSDIVMFSLDGDHASRPECSSTAWALSLTTHTGRAMYALLLSAQSQGKQVYVVGTGACGAWADREEPRYIYIN